MGWVDKNTGGAWSAVTNAPKQVVKAVQNAPGISALSKAATDVFQPIEKAVVQPIGAGLASFDKAVGKMIPGGWGTVGTIAASMIPGMQPMAMAGLGALSGSGILRRGGSFNLQGALMGGAMAYGMSSLAQYAQGAVPTPGAESSFAALPGSELTAEQIASQIANQTGSAVSAAPGSQAAMLAEQAAGLGSAGAQNITSALTAPTTGTGIGSQILAGNFGKAADQVTSNVSQGLSNLGTKASNAYEALTTPETYTDFAKSYGENVSKTGEGVKNLLGLGDMTQAQAAKLATANATQLGLPSLGSAAIATGMGAMGLAEIDAQRDYLNQQLANNAISQQEYNNAMAEINRQAAIASSAVAGSPFSTTPNRDVSIGETLYSRPGASENLYGRGSERSTLYAAGGSVDDSYGMDEARGLATGNMQNGFMGSGMPNYAAGGNVSTPRFLSGGGDGMSDDIPATINGKQEARLADGEFIIPADVVSHLGNGSSKAGAKRLYSMMDKVRTARTGTKKQAPAVNVNKLMPA